MIGAQIINAESLANALTKIGEQFSLSLLEVHEYMMIRFLSQNTLREKTWNFLNNFPPNSISWIKTLLQKKVTASCFVVNNNDVKSTTIMIVNNDYSRMYTMK